MTVVEMIARNARMYPDGNALTELRPSQGIRRQITWQQFDERINRVANVLIERGVSKGDRVIHWMTNSINWLEAYFGIMRTGAWAVPLNFRFDSGDLKYCADIVEAKAVILGEEFTEKVAAVRSQLPAIEHYIFAGRNLPGDMEDFEAIINKASPRPVEVGLNDEDEAALYFTSGTTGAPKPILLSHKNIECTAINEAVGHQASHDDNYLICAPLYHPGAKMHWLGNLIVGGRGTLLTEISPQNMFDAIYREGITRLFLLVPWAQDILGALDRGELRKEDYANLSCCRRLHMGAQPIPPSLVKRWKAYFPDMLYETDYGLTESAGPGCVHLGYGNEHKIGAIGKAGFNWETRIVVNDSDMAQGEVGELLLRGNGVMKGYYKNPELTAEILRGGWLHTGDMAKMDSDGFIYLVDRQKDIVISGGENIFPVEIEEVLQSHPKIYDVAIIGLPDERRGEIVAAIIDPEPHQALTEEEVKEFYQPRLPKYKWPWRIIFDKVPRNPTGKIEKPKLREKYASKKESF